MTIDLSRTDKSIQQILDDFKNSPTYIYPSKLECMKIAATLKNASLQELFDNTQSIQEYLKEPFCEWNR